MCTGIALGNKNVGCNTLSRTLDFVFMQDSELVVLPRGYKWTGLADGVEYTTKYALTGMGDALAGYMFNDGVNEKGLAGAMLYLPGFAEYNKETEAGKLNLAPFEVLKYFLTECANVKEVIEAAKNLRMIDMPIPQFNMELPVHWILSDKDGETVIVETVGKSVQIYEKNVGVMTNSPSYDWHLTNLQNWMHISTTNPTMELNDLQIPVRGEGYGLKLPGGVNPTDRFVRAAIGRQLMLNKDLITSEQEAILHAFKLMDNVAIPKGYMDMHGQPDYSIYKICMSCSEQKYYYKTYKTDTLTCLDLNKYKDITEPKHFKLVNEFIVQEMV